jgi:hypothetical protein
MTLTQTKSYETAQNTPETVTSPVWSEASRVVRGFTTDPVFIESLQQQGINPSDRTTVDYANALSLYAENYVSVYREDGTLEKKQADQITLLANAPYFLHVQKEVGFYEKKREVSHYLSNDEWNYMKGFKPYMVWYNQQLSDYEYTNPDEKMSDLNRALITQSLPSFPRENQMVDKEIKQVTRGARTEAVSRQLLDLTEIEYSPGTIEDDLRGGDFIIIHKGHRIKVDVKSSLSSIAEIRHGYREIEEKSISYAISKNRRDKNSEQHVVVLYPGFEDKDMGDSFRLQFSDKGIQERAKNVDRQLHLAFQELRL